jgi:pyruvate decarboxylase
MSEPLSCSQALLNQIPPSTPTTWTEAFDKVLTDVLQQCRPGYVEVPTDAVHRMVSADGLKTKPVCIISVRALADQLASPTLGSSS